MGPEWCSSDNYWLKIQGLLNGNVTLEQISIAFAE
jgi:hypothetical protein